MRKLSVLLAWLPLLGGVSGALAQCPGVPSECGVQTDLHITTAVLDGPPLVWSANDATLVPLSRQAQGWAMGRTIPLGHIIGLRIAPIGGLPQRLSYNDPNSFPGASDGETVLMPLLHPRHPAKQRGVYP